MPKVPSFLILVAAPLVVGCAGARPAEVSPAEIPELEQRLAIDPDNADLTLRYAAALFSAGRCDSARTVALTGSAMKPKSAIPPLVVGQCLERQGGYDQAIATYRQFLVRYPDERGSSSVRAREMLALRERANTRARAALQQEAQLGAQPGDPRAVAILPIDIAGDSIYQPLSRGLAQILTSDLALLEQFRLVERLQVNALLNEMQLAARGAVDVATAARVGRLLQAGRMVQGLANIPTENDVRLEASVVLTTGEITAPEVATGRFRDLMQMEKDIVIGIAGRLGYQLSEAERRMILENGTQNLTAFLAYSRGILFEDLGDFPAAALHYADAVRADPGFGAAREQFRASTAAQDAQQASPGQVTQAAAETVQDPDAPVDDFGDAMSSTIGDIAATQAEQTAAGNTERTTQQAPNTSNAQAPPTPTKEGTTTTFTGFIRITFRIP